MKSLTVNRAMIRKLTTTAMFSALIIIMTFVPYIGYIRIGPISITTLHIPVIVGGMILGFSGAVTLGTVWGVTCIINALFMPWPENPLFLHPMVSLVPRIIVGAVVGLISLGVRKSGLRTAVGGVMAGVAGTLTNTVLVLTAIGLFGNGVYFPADQTLYTIYASIISVNGGVELGLAVFLTPVILVTLKKVQKGRS